MNIKLRAKLSAYTKGTLPTKVSDLENDLDFISDVKDTEHLYARKENEWVSLNAALERDQFIAGNGIKIEQSGHTYTISDKIWVGTQEAFDQLVNPDPTYIYYTYEDNQLKIINGGTPNTTTFDNIYNGGTPSTESFDIYINPLNVEGE